MLSSSKEIPSKSKISFLIKQYTSPKQLSQLILMTLAYLALEICQQRIIWLNQNTLFDIDSIIINLNYPIEKYLPLVSKCLGIMDIKIKVSCTLQLLATVCLRIYCCCQLNRCVNIYQSLYKLSREKEKVKKLGFILVNT